MNREYEKVNQLADALNLSANQYEELLKNLRNSGTEFNNAVNNANTSAYESLQADISAAKKNAGNISENAHQNYLNFADGVTTQTAKSLGLNAYQKRTNEAEKALQNGIDRSVLAYNSLKAQGQLAAAQKELENAQRLAKMQKNMVSTKIENDKTIYDAQTKERSFERQKLNDNRVYDLAEKNYQLEKQKAAWASEMADKKYQLEYDKKEAEKAAIKKAAEEKAAAEAAKAAAAAQQKNYTYSNEKSNGLSVQDAIDEKLAIKKRDENAAKQAEKLRLIKEAEKAGYAGNGLSADDMRKEKNALRYVEKTGAKIENPYVDRSEQANYNIAVNPKYSPAAVNQTLNLIKAAENDESLTSAEKKVVYTNVYKKAEDINTEIKQVGFDVSKQDYFIEKFKKIGFSDEDATLMYQTGFYNANKKYVDATTMTSGELTYLIEKLTDKNSTNGYDKAREEKQSQAKAAGYFKVKKEPTPAERAAGIEGTEEETIIYTDEAFEKYFPKRQTDSSLINTDTAHELDVMAYEVYNAEDVEYLNNILAAKLLDKNSVLGLNQTQMSIVEPYLSLEREYVKNLDYTKTSDKFSYKNMSDAQVEEYALNMGVDLSDPYFHEEITLPGSGAGIGVKGSEISYSVLRGFLSKIDKLNNENGWENLSFQEKYNIIYNSDWMKNTIQANDEWAKKKEAFEKKNFLEKAGAVIGGTIWTGLMGIGVPLAQTVASPLDSMGVSGVSGFIENIMDYATSESQKLYENSYFAGGETLAAITSFSPQILNYATYYIMAKAASSGSSPSVYNQNPVLTAVKNPAFWWTVGQTLGPTYYEAKNEGASSSEAFLTSLCASLGGAAIEMSGGIQTIPQGKISTIRTLLKTMGEEGLEEFYQGAFTQLTKKNCI